LKLAHTLKDALEAEDFDVKLATAGGEEFLLFSSQTCDPMTLVMMELVRSGLEALVALRNRGLTTPAPMLSAGRAWRSYRRPRQSSMPRSAKIGWTWLFTMKLHKVIV
jgi:DNA-binding response OmpR family regulator